MTFFIFVFLFGYSINRQVYLFLTLRLLLLQFVEIIKTIEQSSAVLEPSYEKIPQVSGILKRS